MSGPDKSGADKTVAGLVAMIELTEKLTKLLAEQARAFERHRPQDAAADIAEVSRLANQYRAGSAHIRGQPGVYQSAPLEVRRRLLRATEAFDAVLQRQGRALGASKTVTEGIVKAIAEEIATKRNVGCAYGPNALRRPVATAITLNRHA
jgi:hypothetical protein